MLWLVLGLRVWVKVRVRVRVRVTSYRQGLGSVLGCQGVDLHRLVTLVEVWGEAKVLRVRVKLRVRAEVG